MIYTAPTSFELCERHQIQNLASCWYGCKPEFLNEFWVVGVDGASIEDGGDLVELLSWSEAAVLAKAGLRSHKVHAAPIVLLEEVVLKKIFLLCKSDKR